MKKSTESPARAALAQLNSEIAAAESTVAQLEVRADRLRTIIARAAPAEHRLALAIDADDAEALAALAAGNASPIAADLDAADHAKRAALAAEKALPRAIEALEKARDEVSRLEARKPAAVAAVLVEHADAIGKKYREAFDRLAGLHDQLRGVASGLATVGAKGQITLTSDALEVPRFNLPSMPVGDVFSHYLRHTPDGRVINASAVICRKAAASLMEDAATDLSGLFAPEAIAAAIERDRSFDAPSAPRLVITRRHRDEPPGTVNEVICGERRYATPRKESAAG